MSKMLFYLKPHAIFPPSSPISLGIFLCVGSLSAQLGGAARFASSGHTHLIPTLSCSRFEWIGADNLSDKASLIVPVELDGQEYRFQLDTAVAETMLYGMVEAKQRGWREIEPNYIRVPNIRIGGRQFPSGRIFLYKYRDPGKTAGTLGFDFLISHLVVLDFPNQRFCVVPRKNVPEEIWQRTAFVPAEIYDGRLFVQAVAHGKRLDRILYDTGASAFPISVDLGLWKELTGKRGPEEATKIIETSGWGRKRTLIGAPILGSLKVGTIRIEQPLVYSMLEQPDYFKEWPGFAVSGLIGNVLFWDNILVLDLGPIPRLGIYR